MIETKDMNGWIFASPGQQRWTQTLMADRWSRLVGIKSKRFAFYNPQLQNEGHARALVKLGVVDPREIRPVVVFVGDAELKTAEKFVRGLKSTSVRQVGFAPGVCEASSAWAWRSCTNTSPFPLAHRRIQA